MAWATGDVYRPALHADAALAELRRCAGTRFDPAAVDAFGEAYAGLVRTGTVPRAA
ncbi:hypothetical protein [Baekduia soli]|uniref:hypothetical protein n=1 Tax=Baekduia soli TaxID=496014 RepID=UPI001651F9F0|nr:hypothetical protein [Baekduia soli]